MLITREQFACVQQWAQEIGARWESLTEREQEVVRILAHGKSKIEIAQALSVTVRTVEMHLTHAMGKLDVRSRVEVVVWVRDNLPDDMWKSTG